MTQTDRPAQVRAIADAMDRMVAWDDLLDHWAEHLRAAATRIEQLEQALKAVEWGWHHARCPCCNRPKAELGHYPDCVLAIALDNAIP